MWTNTHTNIHLSVSVFFFDLMLHLGVYCSLEIGCYMRFVAYPITKTTFHSQFTSLYFTSHLSASHLKKETHTHTSPLTNLSKSKSKSKSCYDRRSVSQYVVVSSSLWNLWRRYYILSESCCVVSVGRPLWREGESVSCQSLSAVFSPLSQINAFSYL
jgi:hypothetical protein